MFGRRVYIYDFIDKNGDSKQIESRRKLNEFEQQIKINEHNIQILSDKYKEFKLNNEV